MPKGQSNDTIIRDLAVVAGVGILAYLFLKSQGLIKDTIPTSTEATPQCPHGSEYTRGFFQDCDPNYVASGWFQEKCTCLSR